MNYHKIYNSIIERAKERTPHGYVERHHIIPKCLGGVDSRENLVSLTPEEHFLCHVLLVKMYPNSTGLIYAVNMMCRPVAGRKKRRLYGWLKRKYSIQRKIDSKLNNSSTGTIWINKTGTLENRKISKEETIPTGWQKGRVLKFKTPTISSCIHCGKPTGRQRAKYCSDHWEVVMQERGEFLWKTNEKTFYVTNGKSDKRIKEGDTIPEGFRIGRTKGLRRTKKG